MPLKWRKNVLPGFNCLGKGGIPAKKDRSPLSGPLANQVAAGRQLPPIKPAAGKGTKGTKGTEAGIPRL
jgi:hypothetical protein